MFTRLAGRVLKGSDIRDIETKLRNGGLKREFYRQIQRGDSPAALNRTLRQIGYNLNRHQMSGYISSKYSVKTHNRYTARIVERYGAGSIFTAETFANAGFKGEYHAKIRITSKNGDVIYREVVVRKSRYDSSQEALSDLQDILPDLFKTYDFEGDETFEIAEFKVY